MLAEILTSLIIAASDPVVAPDSNSFAGEVQETLEPSESGSHGSNGSAVSSKPSLPSCANSGPGESCVPVIECFANPNSPTGYSSLITMGMDDSGRQLPLEVGECAAPEASPLQQQLPAAVLRAFQRVPLPEPALDIQPPKGKTLIGLETIFSTRAESFTRTLNLLGRRVELRIEATSFEWRHGDETTQQTDWPGKPWREGLSVDSYITHVYEHTGSVTPSVSVTWSAEYRVDNGPWLPVNGTVTRASQPTALEIVEAEPRLVAP